LVGELFPQILAFPNCPVFFTDFVELVAQITVRSLPDDQSQLSVRKVEKLRKRNSVWASWAFLACGVLFSWGRRWWRRACFSLQGGALVLLSRVSRVVFCRLFADRSDFRAMKSYYMAATSASRPPDLPGVFFSQLFYFEMRPIAIK
jgi:hypothetical protein